MAQPQFGTDFGDTFFVTKEDDFGAGTQKGPTGDGVALDDGEVTVKGFASREDSQHLLKPPFPNGT
jgi:hypothetical protein